MRKSVLVFGGAGFIGSCLAEGLCYKGYQVTIFDKALDNYVNIPDKIGIVLGDIRDGKLPAGKYDYIYHLADLNSIPLSSVHPEDYISTNIWGTQNIIQSYPETRTLFCSSFSAMESKNVYGASKRSAEHFLSLHKNSVSVRLPNIFGERQKDLSLVVPSFCYALKYNKKAVIYGNGKIKRDYVYVWDLVGELIRIGESRIKGLTETGYGDMLSTLELYNILSRIAKKPRNVSFAPARKEDIQYPQSKYIIKEPKYGLTEGLRRTMHWYLEERGC
jgi:nucleoside-diphosphate-sugar epimerase